MRKRDRKALGEYIRHIANELQLRDWTIVLMHEPCSDELAGHCVCVDSQREAHIAVSSSFRSYPPEEQRETIVHELLHVHHESCWRMVQKDLAEPLGKIAYYVFCDSCRRSMEYAIDAIAKAIAQRLPLIDWPS